MILHAANGTVYKVHFRHFLPVKPQKIKGKGCCRAAAIFKVGLIWYQTFAKRPRTQCWLHEGYCRIHPQDCISKPGPIFAEARCSPRDTFTKRMGRALSLDRALRQLLTDDELRLQLLADYANQIGRLV